MALKAKKLPKKNARAAARRKSGLADFEWTGAETWSGAEFHRARHKANSDYYYNFKSADLITSVFDWMKQNDYTAKDIKAAKAANYIPVQAGIIARCLLNGMPAYHKEHAEYWRSLAGTSGEMRDASEVLRGYIDEAITKGQPLIAQKEAEAKAAEKNKVKPKTIQEVMRETAVSMCETIDEFIEDFIINKDVKAVKDFDPLSLLRKAEAKPNHARLIRNFYEGEYNEFVELNTKVSKEDRDDMREQLEEGYDHLSTEEKKASEELYKKIVDACDIVIAEAKSTRSPRKPKQRSAEQLVSKLKFKSSDADYGIASVPPALLIGGLVAVVFNCKTRKLGVYVAKDSDGFKVKGTSLLDFEESTSLQKTLRKPNEVLPKFKKTTRARTVKMFNEITTTETKLNGRFNEETVILAVFK